MSPYGVGPPPSDVDVAVVYSKPTVTDLVTDLLWPARLSVLCHPNIAARCAGKSLGEFIESNELVHVRLSDLPRHHLWSQFVRQAGLNSLNVERGLVFDTALLAVQYALSGEGIALIDSYLFADYIRTGRLVKPFEDILDDGYGYYLITHPEALGDTAIALFRSWLIERFGSGSAGRRPTSIWRYPMSDRNGDELANLDEKSRPGGGDRRRRGRRQRAVPLDQGRLEGRAADRARGADVGLDLARGRRHAHRQRRSERRQAAAIHHRALQGDRAHLGAVLRRAHHRRHHARRHARAARLAEDGEGARPLPRHGPRDHLGRRGGEAVSAHGQEAFRGRDVRSDRRPCRSVRRDPCLCQVGADRRRRNRAPNPRDRSQAAARRHLGRDHRAGQRARRARGECRRVCGRARSAAWSASSCRFSPWNISI